MQHDDYYARLCIYRASCKYEFLKYHRLISRAVLNLFACKVSCKAVSGRGRVSRLAAAVIGNASGSEASRSHAVSSVYIDPRGACIKRRVAGVCVRVCGASGASYGTGRCESSG